MERFIKNILHEEVRCILNPLIKFKYICLFNLAFWYDLGEAALSEERPRDVGWERGRRREGRMEGGSLEGREKHTQAHILVTQ